MYLASDMAEDIHKHLKRLCYTVHMSEQEPYPNPQEIGEPDEPVDFVHARLSDIELTSLPDDPESRLRKFEGSGPVIIDGNAYQLNASVVDRFEDVKEKNTGVEPDQSERHFSIDKDKDKEVLMWLKIMYTKEKRVFRTQVRRLEGKKLKESHQLPADTGLAFYEKALEYMQDITDAHGDTFMHRVVYGSADGMTREQWDKVFAGFFQEHCYALVDKEKGEYTKTYESVAGAA